MVEYDGPEQVEQFCLTFAVDVEHFDRVVTVPLKPGGDTLPVTEDNRQEYTEAYVDYVLNKSVKQQFEAFNRGFMKLFHGPAISLFNAQVGGGAHSVVLVGIMLVFLTCFSWSIGLGARLRVGVILM